MHLVGFNCDSCITMHDINNVKKTSLHIIKFLLRQQIWSAYPITCTVCCSEVPLTLTGTFLMTYFKAKLDKDAASPSLCLRPCHILNGSFNQVWTFTWASVSFIIALTNLISLPGIPASYIILKSFQWLMLSKLADIHTYLVYLNAVLPAFHEHSTVHSWFKTELPILKPAWYSTIYFLCMALIWDI
jgi:hypothetical protein